ncbi:uncharacterized protein LOC117929321 [Vitis riparia]|uniref:uncharacterized protein LOC117929321 n=1 Tax=Vitis riparia TaxID=96939 RepID=UPI00155A934A|nr:uncharacterized protein LOC117929321 [Vitis riparia]
MDEFSSNQATDSHTRHLDSNSNQVAADDATQTQIRSQSAAGDGSQAEIITMDASLYKAAADGNIHALQQFPEVDLQYSQAPKRILSSILQPNSVSFAVLNGCLSFLGVHRYCIGKI